MLTILVVANLKPDDGIKDEAFKFAKNAPKAFHSLMEFWWEWGVDHCYDIIEREVRRAFKREERNDKRTEMEILRIRKTDACMRRFVFIHWEDIKSSIRNKHKIFPHDTK